MQAFKGVYQQMGKNEENLTCFTARIHMRYPSGLHRHFSVGSRFTSAKAAAEFYDKACFALNEGRVPALNFPQNFSSKVRLHAIL